MKIKIRAWYRDEDWIKELWTGLTSSNGVDIYEGDIVCRGGGMKTM